MPDIRDFIYLDWERIRSFVAQVDRGVPETRTGAVSDEQGSTAEIGGSLVSILSGRHADDARYVRSATETRSLHHAVFTDFERHLETAGLLRDAMPWEQGRLAEGGFFRVDGLVRLVDYSAVVGLARGLKGLMQVGFAAQKSEVLGDDSLDQQQKQQQVREIDRELKAQSKSLNERGIEGIASTIEDLYGDVVRVKIAPDADTPFQVFIGTCSPEAIDPGFRRAIGSRGYSTLWGLEALIFVEPIALRPVPSAFPTGNQLEDAIDGFVSSMDNLATITSGYQFPAVSCVPLAVYRVLAGT